jgi:hypothetical protein
MEAPAELRVPFKQEVQKLAASGDIFPAWQVVQIDEFAKLNVPPGQVSHVPEASKLENFPAGQMLHSS